MSLSTHVLDTVRGIPAEGVKIQLWKVHTANERTLINEVTTNSDGRVGSFEKDNEKISQGVYELVFLVADYFSSNGDVQSDIPFLDQVPIRFGISDENSHYHVPLLISPWAYSTYRGS